MNEQNEISELEELKKLAPTLSSLKKENHFSVPSTYFDEFPMALKNKIDEQENSSKNFSLNWLFNYKLLAPVGTCIVLILSSLLFYNPTETIELEELTAEEIQLSFEYEGYHTVDDELLAELYYSEEAETTQKNSTTNELTDQEIIDYLLEENIDETQIYYEL
ncbi:MAG: hypothetical protein JKY53_11245 [Flavobacteriales bacterium]|nr:hypothetical protein [Flavobacteriales bacterium]